MKAILGILVISLLGSAALAYGLSTEFLFKFDSGTFPTGSTSNSTHIFISDSGTDQVEIFDLSGNSVDSFSTVDPHDVAVNSTHIFVTRDNGNIDLFDLSGNFDTSLNSVDLTAPRGITVNSTHVFVVDTGTNQVVILNLSGIIVDTVGTVELGDPTDVTIDSNGRIIVSDTLDDRIEIFDASGNYLSSSSFGSTGTGDGQFNFPSGVDVDSNDRIIVSDTVNINVQIFDASGNFVTTFGSSGTNDGEFSNPSSVTVDTSDRIIISDENGASSRIQVFAYASESSTSGGSSANKHKTAPTSGLDWNTHAVLVEGGINVDGKTLTLTDNWWTSFEQIQIGTDSTHTFSVKTFAQNGGIMVQEMAFGITQVGDYQNAETVIEVHYDWDKTISDVVIVQDTEVIDVSTLRVSTDQVQCRSDSDAVCYQTDFILKFNEPLKDKVYAVKAFDMQRRIMMPHYFNDGISVFGESVNPMLTMQIVGTEKFEGLVTITQTEKYSNLWVAEDGRLFDADKHFKQINKVYVAEQVDRNSKCVWNIPCHNEFNYSRGSPFMQQVVDGQAYLASQLYFDSSKIQGVDGGFIPAIVDTDGDHREQTLQSLDWYNVN